MNVKLFILILVFTVGNSFGFARSSNHHDKEKKFPSTYKEGIVVNGNSSEWANELFNFNKQAQVNYAIVNDTAAIYICLRIADDAAQMKILKSGIDICFNTRGKKKAEAKLHFPIGSKPDAMSSRVNPGDRRGRKNIHLMFLLQMQDMELSGFKSNVNGFQNIKSGKNGVLAAINWDSTNVMVYEARIPFTAFNQDVKSLEPLNVGIIIKGTPKPVHPPDDTQNGQDMAGQGNRGGMRPGGGVNQAQLMEQRADNQKMYEDDEIWRSIAIAKKE